MTLKSNSKLRYKKLQKGECLLRNGSIAKQVTVFKGVDSRFQNVVGVLDGRVAKWCNGTGRFMVTGVEHGKDIILSRDVFTKGYWVHEFNSSKD
jgi:hypothetical protein